MVVFILEFGLTFVATVATDETFSRRCHMERVKFSQTTGSKLNAKGMRGWSKSIRKGDLFAARVRGLQKKDQT